MDIDQLNRRFGIPGTAEVVAGHGGLPKVHVTAGFGSADVYLHGAHVTSWAPADFSEVFFLSSGSRWQEGSAIRGGVPICFPWFGNKADDPKAPAHGFVRTMPWDIESVSRSSDSLLVALTTSSNQATRRLWDAGFRLVYRASFGLTLQLELELHNTGTTPLRFEEALHAYFQVGDLGSCEIMGLDSVSFLDKTDGYREKLQDGPLRITSETDRVYMNTESAVEISDPVLHRRIRIAKKDSRNTVIWNPWAAKAAAISDLPGNEWSRMVCVETSNVLGSAVTLDPGQSHCMSAVIEILSS